MGCMWKRRKACCRSFSLLQKFIEKQKDDNKICLLSWEWWSKRANNNNDIFRSMLCSNVEEMCRGGQRAGEGYLLLGLCRGAPFLFRWWTKKTEKKRSVFLVWLIIKI